MNDDKIGGTLSDDDCRRCDVTHDVAQPCKPMARGWRAHAYRRVAALA